MSCTPQGGARRSSCELVEFTTFGQFNLETHTNQSISSTLECSLSPFNPREFIAEEEDGHRLGRLADHWIGDPPEVTAETGGEPMVKPLLYDEFMAAWKSVVDDNSHITVSDIVDVCASAARADGRLSRRAEIDSAGVDKIVDWYRTVLYGGRLVTSGGS